MCPGGLYPCGVLLRLRRGDAAAFQLGDPARQAEDCLSHLSHVRVQGVDLFLQWGITVFRVGAGTGQINQLRALLIREGALEPDGIDLFQNIRQFIAARLDYVSYNLMHYVPPTASKMVLLRAANLLSI